jgi:Tol biopolymer transport system component
MNINFDKTTGVLEVKRSYDDVQFYYAPYEIVRLGLDNISTNGNEYGPNLIVAEDGSNEYYILIYSTDVSGDSQIKYISNKTEEYFSVPKEVEFLNSDFDDMYPTFNPENSKIYFCSNRNGEDFDFFYVNLDSEMSVDSILSTDLNYEVHIDSTLSSNYNDKCPAIFENKLVFASDREGGYGGFDLYYSNFENGEWSEPVNFGEKINSEHDEYRPILIDEGVSENQTMMVFSSNRPVGLGGFDLYFVGILNE